ncbi:metallophosphoesterase family protein [Nevskia ramosa]|uniref:metallophosphoesterase family protein n=1 Tax=Nevskia ramosa TaxID=64002 RepID=UPI0003B33A07|nr:metallophosphoesterase [Nevskia ramosa]
MSLVLHLSDTHFGTERAEVVEALLQLAREQQPDVAILSGDITQRSRTPEFAAARKFIDALAARSKLILPGNHDIPLFEVWRRLFAPYRNLRRAFGRELEPDYEDDSVLIIGVNTTSRFRHVDGRVSSRQIERVRRRLLRCPASRLKLVVTHQPVHVQHVEDEHNLLHGRRAAMQVWSAAGADLILGGHIHLPFTQALQEVHQLPREIFAVQAGTAVSRRTRAGAPNSVNLIRHQPGTAKCAVERWDYDADQQRFAPGSITDLALDRRPLH